MMNLTKNQNNSRNSNGQSPLNGQNPSQRPLLQSAGAGPRELVMLEFQRSSLEMTRKFLQAQESVMLAYLQGAAMPLVRNGDQSQSAPAMLYAQNQILEMQAAELSAETEFVYPDNGNGNSGRHLNLQPMALSPEQRACAAAEALPLSVIEAAASNAAASNAESTSSPAQTAFAAPTAATVRTEAAAEISAAKELSPEKLIDALVQIVSERTGYPPEMLDPELDLEADLGIDSIKRVEILNSFRKLLPESAQLSLEDGIEKLAGVKTLQGIMDWIRSDLAEVLATAS